MIRIDPYAGGEGPILTRGVQPGSQPVLRTASGRAEDSTLAAMLQSGLKLTDMAVREYISDETTRVAQSLQQMNEELAAEQERYMKENQGPNALNAGEHFKQFARDLAEKHLADGKFQGRFQQAFMQQAAGNARYFMEQGQSYAARERAAWQDAVLKREIDNFQDQVARNCDNKDWLEFNLVNLVARIENMRPGMDNRALLDGIRKDTAEGVIDGFLSAGRMDDAYGAFAQYKDNLGDRASPIRARIDARADALQAKAEAQRKKAEEEQQRQATASDIQAVLANVAEYPTLAEQEKAALRMVDNVAQPEVQEKLRAELSREFAWREKVSDATAARQVRQFQELARTQGWTPRHAAEALARATNISDAARETLARDFNGRTEKATPENKAALAELRRQIDAGAENGGMDSADADAIDAFIYRHGLTGEQSARAHRYAERKGSAADVTQTQINRAYTTLFPNRSASVPGDLLELVEEELKRTAAGRPVTDAEVRRVMARLFTEGEIESAGWFSRGVGTDEEYRHAPRDRRDENRSAGVEVPAEHRARIEHLLREAGANPTPERIRRYYQQEQEVRA